MIKHKNVLVILITFCNSTNNNVNLFFSQQAIFEISRQARNDIAFVILSEGVCRNRRISDFARLLIKRYPFIYYSKSQVGDPSTSLGMT